MIHAYIKSITGSELQQIFTDCPSGIVGLQFTTEDGGNTYYPVCYVYKPGNPPSFCKVPLTKVFPMPLYVDQFHLGTLIFRYKEFPIDPAKVYYLYPAYKNSDELPHIDFPYVHIIYSHSNEDLLKLFSQFISKESFKKLSEADLKKALEKLNELLLAEKSFNPIPPKLIP